MKAGEDMEKDLDIKLYNEYLDGNKEAFELLYNKYKRKIQYFVYNIVKDYQKSEDITQDVFVYIMQNEIKEGYTFKYYIYLVARSRAYNHINTEKKRIEITKGIRSGEIWFLFSYVSQKQLQCIVYCCSFAENLLNYCEKVFIIQITLKV